MVSAYRSFFTPRQKKIKPKHVSYSIAGLQQLKGITALRELNLTKSKVTPAGVAELQSTLPLCHIA